MKLDDYLVTYGNDKFRRFLGKSKTYSNKKTEGGRMNNDKKIFLSYESSETPLIYNIERIMSQRKGLKVSLKILKDGRPILSDMPNLSSSKIRTEVARKCFEKSKVDQTLIEKDLLVLEEECTNKIEQDAVTKDLSKEPILTEEDNRAALDFLNSPNLINQIKSDIVSVGVIGEELNGLMIYFVGTSRVFESPLSVIFKGGSSSGKSHTVSSVLKLFPPSDVLNYAYLSSKALFHIEGDGLKHKILYIAERPGAEASDYSIRLIQSDKKLKIGVTTENKSQGGHKMQDKEVEGPVAYIETTTNATVHPENETRVFSLYADESLEQTKRIQSIQKLPYLLEESAPTVDKESVIKKHNAAQKLLKPSRVKIPYINEIQFPSSKIRYRRDFPRFLSLIECSALLHQFQREKLTDNNQVYILANLDDYEIACTILKAIQELLSEIPPKSRQLMGVCKEFVGEFSRNNIQKTIRWPLHEITNYLEPLISYGYLEEVSGSKGQRYLYKVTRALKTGNLQDYGILSVEELRNKIQKQKFKSTSLVTTNLKT